MALAWNITATFGGQRNIRISGRCIWKESALPEPQIHQVRFGFSPKGNQASEKILLEEPDTTLFVPDPQENIFKKKQMRFPLLSHT